jgi:biopolymer transport protein ExbD
MFLPAMGQFRSGAESGSFNMTAVIDIVFLLIIFFLVVCQFIEAENYPVAVPDGCQFAQDDTRPGTRLTTVTVMRTIEGASEFAVGSHKVSASSYANMAQKMAGLIDVRLKDLPPDRRVVTLRIDRDVCFAEAQYALAAVAASTATDIQLAALKNKRIVSE